MGRFADRLEEGLLNPEFREGYEEAQRELQEHCIVFNWHGAAPSKNSGDAFVAEALEALEDIAERHGCHVGGGFQVAHNPCDDCANLAECPFGRECVTCNPPTSAGAVFHMKQPAFG